MDELTSQQDMLLQMQRQGAEQLELTKQDHELRRAENAGILAKAEADLKLASEKARESDISEKRIDQNERLLQSMDRAITVMSATHGAVDIIVDLSEEQRIMIQLFQMALPGWIGSAKDAEQARQMQERMDKLMSNLSGRETKLQMLAQGGSGGSSHSHATQAGDNADIQAGKNIGSGDIHE